jgi:hypothetical protein
VVLLMAVGASAAVLGASATGLFTPVLAAAAMVAACCIAAVNFFQTGRGVVADTLAPLDNTFASQAVIAAPTAADVAGRPISHTDAA